KMPLTLGHELSGIVREVANDADQGLVGKPVSIIPLMNCGVCDVCQSGHFNLCSHYTYLGSSYDGGFAELVTAPVRSLIPVPETLGLDEVAAIDPYSVGLHALRMAEYRGGQSAIILGAGAIGLTTANYLLDVFGSLDVTVADVVPEKLEIARNLGAKTLDLKAASDLSQYRADVVVIATAAPSAIATAILMVNKRGVITVPGISYQDISMPARTWEQILRREARVVGSWNYVWSAMPENEWVTTISYIAAQRIQPRRLITHHFKLDQAVEAFETAFNDPKANMVMFDINA
ncbi:MAG: alcohol dehydrogenase catalytic domain-containing protein, partial [Chloroflexi bacterium]|nr:alcohol dehydrogenase catalytic domain-containing protein [Chloroflexota bacterium]